ncbi:MAG TPA: putative peptide modification system cyclase [Xanthomonadaceae bacterium]|nr:putative peptide modification system cyclase [Xanthomonadaceae bacterium]
MNDAHQPKLDAPQLRTLLLTDLCDSMTLVEQLGDSATAELFREHDHLVLLLQRQWRGRLIDRSDGLLLLFERPIDGLGFALDYARGLQGLGHDRNLKLHARAGLHVGEVLTWHNSEEAVQIGAKPLEVEGLAKPMAARLMSLARPGQILLSAVAESLTHRAARELGERGERLLWKSHGRWRFKGVPTRQEIYEVGEIGVTPLRAPKNSNKAWRDLPLWRRPAALVAEAALLAAFGIGTWFMTRPEPAIAFAERDWVVVGDLRNLTGNTLLDESLHEAFRISLEQSRYVNLLSDLKVRDTLTRMERDPNLSLDRETASEIAMRDGARAVIIPTVAEVGGRLKVTAEVIDPKTQATVYSESVTGRGIESVLASVDQVSGRLRHQLGEAVQSIDEASAPLPEVTTSNLDALRAYAMGVDATSKGEWKQAEQNFGLAVRLDRHFALAYIGVARVLAAVSDRASAMPYLRKALELKSRLPARDRLYLEAWAAELDDAPAALTNWQQLARLYPDNFAAHGNSFWHLYQANQFSEALVHAKAADMPQDPYRSIAIDDIGRVYLAQGKLKLARTQFEQMDLKGKSGPIRRLANVLALQGDYAGAEALIKKIRKSGYADDELVPTLDAISFKVDQGRWAEAATEAANAVERSRSANEFTQAQFGFIQLSLLSITDGPEKVLPALKEWFSGQSVRQSEASLGKPYGVDHASLLVATAYLAQRAGDDSLSEKALAFAKPWLAISGDPTLDKLINIVRSGQHRLKGDHEQAIELVAPRDDDLLQTRVALYLALDAAGEHQKALEQAEWISNQRGLAYGEASLAQSLQTLNVADTRLARRRQAQSLSQLNRGGEAEGKIQELLSAWPALSMPGYLRETLDAILPASKQKTT